MPDIPTERIEAIARNPTEGVLYDEIVAIAHELLRARPVIAKARNVLCELDSIRGRWGERRMRVHVDAHSDLNTALHKYDKGG